MAERLRRPPAVPLVVMDPYTSIWSFADRLTDDWPRHWTGTRMALYAVVRVDGVAWRLMGGPEWLPCVGEQTSCKVSATTTSYSFRCGHVDVRLIFTTPLLADDLDLLSRPVTYVTFEARSLDGRDHRIACYFDMTGDICVNHPHERVVWSRSERDGIAALSFRHATQPVLEKRGDHLRIDWGTAWLAGRANIVTAAAGEIGAIRDAFAAGETIEGRTQALRPPRKVNYIHEPVLALAFGLDAPADQAAQETILIGYDDEYSIEFFGRKLRPWWRRHEDLDGLDMLAAAMRGRDAVLARARVFDEGLEARARTLAGDGYADLCALVWRQTIAAHKLCAGPDGRPLFFSKENFSNGCIATVDVTYASAPLFLAFNPALLKAMIDPYFDYCASPQWPFPFAAHDLGVYPQANGQAYRGFDVDPGQPIVDTQMPVEECGNMLILVGALVATTNEAGYARERWGLLRQWADYLVEAGHDPGVQLCTDDFSGALGHNVNLSAKAAMGLAAFAMMAERLGDAATAVAFRDRAAEFVGRIARARQSEAIPLAFDLPDTWSLKYNLLWDRILGFGLVVRDDLERETRHYRGRAEPFGVPLDGRSMITKPEWLLWAASLCGDRAFFRDCIDRILRFANATPNRVPLTDLYLADNARQVGFQARSVWGGAFVAFLRGW
jgi:hypothetical protein